MEFFSTKRLVLRITEEQDMASLVSKVFTDTTVTQHLFTKRDMMNGLSTKQAEKYIRDKLLFRPAPYGLCVLALRESNEPIGIAGVLKSILLKEREYEFCFAIKKDLWGQGYATEIGHAQIHYGFNQLYLPKLFASVCKNNRASIKVLKKLNMKLLYSDCPHNNWLIYVINNPNCHLQIT